jgi:hypothetical protein
MIRQLPSLDLKNCHHYWWINQSWENRKFIQVATQIDNQMQKSIIYVYIVLSPILFWKAWYYILKGILLYKPWCKANWLFIIVSNWETMQLLPLTWQWISVFLARFMVVVIVPVVCLYQVFTSCKCFLSLKYWKVLLHWNVVACVGGKQCHMQIQTFKYSCLQVIVLWQS